jgi:hypothetical protein
MTGWTSSSDCVSRDNCAVMTNFDCVLSAAYGTTSLHDSVPPLVVSSVRVGMVSVLWVRLSIVVGTPLTGTTEIRSPQSTSTLVDKDNSSSVPAGASASSNQFSKILIAVCGWATSSKNTPL